MIIRSLELEKLSFHQQMDLIKKTLESLVVYLEYNIETNQQFAEYKDQLLKKGWNCNDLFLEERMQRYCK